MMIYMNTSSRTIVPLSVAMGLIVFAATTAFAQQPRSAAPTTAPTAPTAPGTTQSPTPTQTTPNPAPTQTTPNPAPTQTTPNPAPTQTWPNPAPTQPNTNPTQSDPTQSRERTGIPPTTPFSSLDSNGDTRISVGEFSGSSLGAFKSMDTNGDGRISGAELTNSQPSTSPSPLSSAQIREFDTDGDSVLSDAETSKGIARAFKNLDLNGDGFVSEAELNGRQSQTDREVGDANRNTDMTDAGVNRSR